MRICWPSCSSDQAFMHLSALALWFIPGMVGSQCLNQKIGFTQNIIKQLNFNKVISIFEESRVYQKLTYPNCSKFITVLKV